MFFLEKKSFTESFADGNRLQNANDWYKNEASSYCLHEATQNNQEVHVVSTWYEYDTIKNV